MNLLVGASGFVGGHVVEYLFQQGEISKGIFRKGSHLKTLDASGVQVMEADLLDHHSLHEAMDGVDVIYNLASPMPGYDTDFMRVNTEGLQNLLEVAVESKARAFVHLSTLDVFGFGSKAISASSTMNPSGEYQKSKAAAERVLAEFAKRAASMRVVVIRPARAVGSRDQTLVVPMLQMIDSGRAALPTAAPMSFAHPRDIAQAMYKAATNPAPTGSVFMVKSFDSTIRELAASVASALGTEVEIKGQGLFAGSAFPKYTAEQLKAALRIDDQGNWSVLGYVPQYNLKSTGEEIAAWYRKEPWVTESA
jgi:dihydroflavonol-4-reductase